MIAYKQPITAAEIAEIRGVNTSGVLTTLLERHLIKIVGRKKVVGRPFLYAHDAGVPDPVRPEGPDRPAEGRGHGRGARLRSAGACSSSRRRAEEMLPLEEEPGQYDGVGEASAAGADEPAREAAPAGAEDAPKDEEPSQEG